MPVTLVKKVGANDIKLAPTWRKRWDSNPRAREDYLISSHCRVKVGIGNYRKILEVGSI